MDIGEGGAGDEMPGVSRVLRHGVPLEEVPRPRLDHVPVRVEDEISRPGVDLPGAAPQGEVPRPLDGGVGGHPRVLHVSLGEAGVDGADDGAVPHLHGVDPAEG